MKIVCDSCATKYSISDDKVRGKVFKIRCKKCSHIIVVRGTADAAAAPAAAVTAESGGWHLVVDGEQVGPLPEAEIRARLGRGEINGETYIWKEGLADWLKLATVPEFADAASPGAQPTDVAGGAGDLFTDSAPLSRGGEAQVQVDEAMVASSAPAPSVARVGGGGGGGLFSAVDAAAASAAVSPARVGRGSADHDDGFGAPMAARGGGGDLFASHAASSASVDEGGGRRGPGANHDGGRVESLTAQRHENSVLFSLANLQQLAMPTVAPKASAPVTNGNGSSEGSGLIDIRAMAATTMGGPSASGGGSGGLSDDLPTFGSFSAAAPVLLPIPTQSGPPKWMYAVIGGMVILVVGIAVMAYKILTTKPVTEIVQVPVPAPAPPPTAVALAPKAAATPTTPGAAAIPEDKLPPREGEPGGEAAKAAGDGAKHDKGAGHEKKPGKGGGKDKKGGVSADTGGGKAAPAAAAAAPEPEKKGPAKGSLDDLLDNALSGKSKSRNRAAASDEDAPAPRRAAAPPPEAAGPLSKSAVVAGMNAIKPKINDCYNQFKVPGMAMVMVVIGKNGKVSSASVSGKFAGTPSGACVEKAVKSASFPPSEGLSTPYPFQLK